MMTQRINLARMSSRLLLLFFFSGTVTWLNAQDRCIKVDLQGVSIDPVPATAEVGQTATVMVVMKNNGPCTIPKGEGTAQVTLDANILDLGTPLNFTDICGQWTYLGVISENGYHNLFFQTNEAEIPAGGKFCFFQFDVKVKKWIKDPTLITMGSSLSATATTADLDGKNQSAGTELRISASPLPFVLAEFNAGSEGCNAILGWKTSAEKNVTAFEVEQSTDGHQFTKVGSVPAKNAGGGSDYQFTYNQGDGVAYYRLKVIEKSGPAQHSKLIVLDTKCGVKKGFAP